MLTTNTIIILVSIYSYTEMFFQNVSHSGYNILNSSWFTSVAFISSQPV